MKSSTGTTTVLLSVAAFAVFAVAFAAAAAPPSTCDPRYECSFRYVDSTNKVYAFDFSTLCAEQDYVLADKNGRIYHANICGNAHEACIPEQWSVNFNHGVAVQSWGPKPSCDKKRCFAAGSAQPVCCTRDCQVLGTSEPMYSVSDPSNPGTGGVIIRHQGVAPSPSDPFWCPFNPATGAQYERSITYDMRCDPTVPGVAPVGVTVDPKNDCDYTFTWYTAKACANSTSIV